ncbi:XrtA/PEP-CTERM system TPR-repeat protein PrsT [Kineobactrum salinum]|uniref:PEP-CTERM system TPR-repeat protein PrsT n=1 Tax=Kineobactrum salinum TaxID=2708301 RepID=A0A6C0TZE4_9GAMM|nr:XrtA/PEP-CTERM system TPR-repeat protein PrsT [Kineobactrum salinum]QIB64739.1 PEP-CTERM system TPR-repeat protein PrsT [Kineobactrum salinum]
MKLCPALCIPAVIALALALAACSPSVSEDELLARARTALDQGDARAATIDLKTALQQDADNADARRMLGEAYLFQQNPGPAVDEFERALTAGDDPDTLTGYARALVAAAQVEKLMELHGEGRFDRVQQQPDFLAALGLAQAQGGDTWAAEESFAAAREKAPDSVYVNTAWARYLLGQKNAVDEARELLLAVVETDPEYAEAWSTLGDIYHVGGQFEDARDAYTRATELNSYRLTDRLNLVSMHIELDQHDAAEKELARLQGIMPDHPGVNLAQGRILLEAGDAAAALEEFASVFNVLPNHRGGLYLAAIANIREGNFATARTQLTTFLSKEPRHLNARLQLATVYLQLGEAEAAEDIAREIVEEHEMNYPAMGLLATALSAQGLHVESAEIYQQVAQSQPQSLEARLALGSELVQAGERERGIVELEAARDLQPDNAAVRERLIQAHLVGGDTAAARAEAEAYRELQPESPRPLLLLGRILMQDKDSEAAASYFSQALELEPGNVSANSGMAALRVLDRDLEGARKHYQAALQHHPDDVNTLVNLAKLEEQLGNHGAMTDALRKAVESDAAALEPRLALARVLLRGGRSGEAVTLLNEARERHAGEPSLWQLLTAIHAEAGDYDAAADTGRRLLRLVPEEISSLALVARVELRAGRAGPANEHLQKALEQEPDNTDLRKLETEILLARNKLDEAMAVLQALPPEVAAEPAVKVTKARIDLARGRPAAAEPLLREAMAEDPNSMTVGSLGGALWAQDKRDAAVTLLQEWLAEHPDDVAVRSQLASHYLQTGREADARAEYERVLAQAPDNVMILNNLGWLFRQQDPQRALGYIEKASRLAPDNPQIRDTHAMVRYELGAYPEALALNQRALDDMPGNPELLYHRAVILNGAGQASEAREILESLLSEPEFPQRDEARSLLAQLPES